MKRHILSDGIKCGLVLLFCYTAVSKWLFYDDFLFQLRQSPFLHGGYRFLSLLLPTVELVTSGLLLFPRTAKAGFALSATLLALFTVYITCMLRFAPHVPCCCGGFVSWLSWKQHIILNTAFCLLSVAGYRLSAAREPAD